MGMGGYNPNSGLKNVAGANSVSNTLGYGSDSESRSSLTRSGIGTRNIVIVDDPTGTQAQAIYTDIRSETAEQNSGRLSNAFDRDSVRQDLDLHRSVTQQFAPLAAHTIATASDYLGNITGYQQAEMLKAAIESELATNARPAAAPTASESLKSDQ